jgi:NADH-quinone oxidoreductase subunit J
MVGSFVGIAAVYMMLYAHFLAVIQMLVYAGAIMVLFVFVIMLLNLRHDIDDGLTHVARRVLGWAFGLLLAGVFWTMLRGRLPYGPMGEDSPAAVAAMGNTQAIGVRLYTDYLFPFEVTSLILLVGIIGAVVLAMRRSELVASIAEPRAPMTAAAPTSGARPTAVIGEAVHTSAVEPEAQDKAS